MSGVPCSPSENPQGGIRTNPILAVAKAYKAHDLIRLTASLKRCGLRADHELPPWLTRAVAEAFLLCISGVGYRETDIKPPNGPGAKYRVRVGVMS